MITTNEEEKDVADLVTKCSRCKYFQNNHIRKEGDYISQNLFYCDVGFKCILRKVRKRIKELVKLPKKTSKSSGVSFESETKQSYVKFFNDHVLDER